jgi:transcriptional regulator with XRE-family HTH domain
MKDKRLALKLTQTDVAIAVGVSLVTYQLWERGVTTPTPENQKKLDKILRIEEGLKTKN